MLFRLCVGSWFSGVERVVPLPDTIALADSLFLDRDGVLILARVVAKSAKEKGEETAALQQASAAAVCLTHSVVVAVLRFGARTCRTLVGICSFLLQVLVSVRFSDEPEPI